MVRTDITQADKYGPVKARPSKASLFAATHSIVYVCTIDKISIKIGILTIFISFFYLWFCTDKYRLIKMDP